MAEPELDFNSLDDAALEKALVDASMGEAVLRPGTPRTRDEVPPPEPLPEPEPPPQEAPAEPESVPEPTPEAEPEPAPEPDHDAEAREARELQLEALLKHQESVSGRLGGELGFLKQQLQRMMEERQAPPRQPDNGEYADEPEARRAPPPQSGQPRVDKFALWSIKQAAASAGSQFLAAHPDYAEHAAGLPAYIEQRQIDTSDILRSDDPEYVQARSTQLLNEHYWHVRATAEATRRAELLKKKADQSAAVTEAKKKASVTASGSAPPPKPQAKTLDEMTEEELDEALMRETGGRW